jgi:hypothetical protein
LHHHPLSARARRNHTRFKATAARMKRAKAAQPMHFRVFRAAGSWYYFGHAATM